MNNEYDPTEKHILDAALGLFLKQGIKRTSVDDIAHAAGLTRVTIYRHFPSREQLIEAAFRELLAPLRRAAAWVERTPDADIDAVLDSVVEGLAYLPPGDLTACLDELRRAQPAAHEAFSQVRREALRSMFARLMQVAEAEGRLRPGLKRAVVEAYFMEMIVSFLDHPAPQTRGVTPGEFFATMKNLFLYGILKDKGS